jgi:hypothetical protein
MTKPSFPPIARPTLTAITEAIPFRVDGLSMPGSTFDLGFAESDKVEGDDRTDDFKSTSNPDTSETKPKDKFQTAEYLDMWANIAASSAQITSSKLLFVIATTVYVLIELT